MSSCDIDLEICIALTCQSSFRRCQCTWLGLQPILRGVVNSLADKEQHSSSLHCLCQQSDGRNNCANNFNSGDLVTRNYSKKRKRILFYSNNKIFNQIVSGYNNFQFYPWNYYYVFHGLVTLFFANNFLTQFRITMKFLHNIFLDHEVIFSSHTMFINAPT